MRVRIVCYEDVDTWILGKFALKMQENLIKLGISVDIAKVADPNANINHHIIYNQYDGIKSSIDTLMITHVDNIEKLKLLEDHLGVASLGICMSLETMNWLVNMGMDRNKICYVNPAHDHLVIVKKYNIGITSRVQIDGRKRESFIDNLANDLDPRFFKFRIMGDSWEPQVSNLRKKGFEVDYFNHFIKEEYYKLINSLDYYLYMGLDEGQMGFIDAVAGGIKTIVTPQGYHLDAENAITHPFTTYEELLKIFLQLQTDKSQLVNSVASWNWVDYTIKHVELWKYILGEKKIKSQYKDGLNSLIKTSKDELKLENAFIKKEKRKLSKTKLLHKYLIIKNTIISRTKTDGIGWILVAIQKRLKHKTNN